MLAKLIISWFLRARRNMLRIKLIATYWARSNKYTKGLHKNCLGNFIDYIYRQECFSGKQTTRKVHTKLHSGLEWRIFHILTSDDIDAVISGFYTVVFVKVLLSLLKRNLHDGLKIWMLFSRGKKQYFTHLLRSLLKNSFYHSKIKFISWRRRVISFM